MIRSGLLVLLLGLSGTGCASFVAADVATNASRSPGRLHAAPPAIGDTLTVRRLDRTGIRGAYLGGLPDSLRLGTEADTVALSVEEIESVRGLDREPFWLLARAGALALDAVVLYLAIAPRIRFEL